MATPLSLAQTRDVVRRYLQLVPQFDIDGATIGAASVSSPDPNNALVTQAINDGISAVNRVVRIGAVTDLPPINVPAAPLWKRGPYAVEYSTDQLVALDVAEVLDVVWFDQNSISYRLEPYDYYGPAREFFPFTQYAQEPHPRQYFVLGSQILLLPPPTQSGSLYITQMEGIPPLVADTDTIGYLPINYHPVIHYYAVMILSARSAQDVEAADRFARFRDLALNGLVEVFTWKFGYNQDSVDAIKSTLQMSLPSIAQTPMDQSASGLQNAPAQGGP